MALKQFSDGREALQRTREKRAAERFPLDRSVTALAQNPARPAPSLRQW